MTEVHRNTGGTGRDSQALVRNAWERFVQGEDDVRGVRPEIAISWHRCRDQYRVDPQLSAAPVAVEELTHPLEHDVVFAELGFCAASMAHEVAKIGGIVVIADAAGRVLSGWGDKATRSVADSASLAPWFCWSESAVGTNGMGTALDTYNPVVIRREEHWAEAFHEWSCAGVAVRDVVTKDPIAVLNISCYRSELPAAARAWLYNAANHTDRTLRTRARDGGAELLAAYQHARGRSRDPLVAVDNSGKVVFADETASVLLGVPSNTPAIDPAVRWIPQLPDFIHAARFASKQARYDPHWSGSTQIFTHLTADEPSPISIRPVFLYANLVGHLITFCTSDGEQVPQADVGGALSTARVPSGSDRVAGIRENRTVLVRYPEILLAEAADSDVWLSTDQGRLRAAAAGLDKLDNELSGAGFLRVHRRYVVNLNRVREIERRDKGELILVMDDPDGTTVPVSRRNASAVRRALGI
ncbi:MAG TPA: LytTR family transcriptional regulator DNA-binding domain-containing protein [Flexivirga sp.]|uniref:DNA-binding protein n=1 Tax=Flexivirga sp. TaxID=1962927 RepID=UPI002B5BF1CA|nr:LytTR family transcriptional regulator DNA-binding domain-containing protein [Flexivirga sp.]HWC22995.1 LytTR family transcriptional regulator DNA-binding domain-containing protein [Flexivirga sp.]